MPTPGGIMVSSIIITCPRDHPMPRCPESTHRLGLQLPYRQLNAFGPGEKVMRPYLLTPLKSHPRRLNVFGPGEKATRLYLPTPPNFPSPPTPTTRSRSGYSATSWPG